MPNPTIQVAGEILEAAVCRIRGCRVHPPSALTAHEDAHRRVWGEMGGSWRETAHRPRKGVRGNKFAGRPKGVSPRTKRVCDAITAFVAGYPDGCTSKQILAGIRHHYASHQAGVAALARLLHGGLVDNVIGVKEGRRFKIYPEG